MGKAAETAKKILGGTAKVFLGLLGIIVAIVSEVSDNPNTSQAKEESKKNGGQTKYYIAVKMQFAGELYTVSGPYNSFEEAEADFDMQQMVYGEELDEGLYLGIVSHKE